MNNSNHSEIDQHQLGCGDTTDTVHASDVLTLQEQASIRQFAFGDATSVQDPVEAGLLPMAR